MIEKKSRAKPGSSRKMKRLGVKPVQNDNIVVPDIEDGDSTEQAILKRLGRPPKIRTTADFERLAYSFFQKCIDNKEIPTIHGLAIWCGLSRADVLNEVGSRSAFFDVAVKRAKHYIEAVVSHRLANAKQAPIGLIFYAKNAFGYRDQPEVAASEQGVTIQIIQQFGAPGSSPQTIEGKATKAQALLINGVSKSSNDGGSEERD